MTHTILQFKKLIDLPIFAASGLAKYKDCFYFVADDENSLFQLNLADNIFKEIQIIKSHLPTDHKERKRLKPDWESLTVFPQSTGIDGMLAVPSGSKPNRMKGFFISPDFVNGEAFEVDFTDLFQKLSEKIAELNIEGCAIQNSTLLFFQRGNGLSKQNAIIHLDLDLATQGIKLNQAIPIDSILKIEFYDLGELEHSSLSFTDAFALNDSIYFLAVCEETVSTYEDGPFKGAILGRINSEGRIENTWKMDCPFKPEGLWIERDNKTLSLFIVTDADSREQNSVLYTAQLEC